MVVVLGAEHIGEKVERNLCPPVNASDCNFFADGVVVVAVDVDMLQSAGGFRWITSLCGTFFLMEDGGGDHILFLVA